MKRYLLSSIFILILTTFSLVIYSQSITLRQTNQSGIYRKGQKITVKASTENYVDTLHISVFKNNNQLLSQKNLYCYKPGNRTKNH